MVSRAACRRELLVVSVVGDFYRVVRINVRVIKKARAKLFAKHVRHGAIDLRLRDFSFFHLFRQGLVGVWKRQLDIHSGFQCKFRRRFLGGHHVMHPHELSNAEIVRDHHSIEAPFLTKHADQQRSIAVRRNSINLIVGRHDACHVGFLDCGFEWFEKIFSNHALGVIARRDIGATFGLAMHGKMFRRRQNMLLVDKRPRSLEAFNRRHANARNEIGIFAIGLFRASPARIACEAQHRRQTLLRSLRPNFRRNGGKHVVDQRRIPGRSQANRRRE